MKVALISSALPPVEDAIGDYSARFAFALSQTGSEVALLSDCHSRPDLQASMVWRPGFDLRKQRFEPMITELSRADGPDVALIQYNPFCWGRRGWTRPFIHALQQAKQERPRLTLAVMFHETYTMSPGLKAWAMRQWQYRFYKQLLLASDLRFFSIEAWARQATKTGFYSHHLPVGSNMPFAPVPGRATARAELGISGDDLVLGAFGSSHPSRPWNWIGQAAQAVAQIAKKLVLLYVGSAVDEVTAACQPIRVIAPGRVSAERASALLSLMDIFLAPFVDGVSTRRGSVMAAMQHGLPVATTSGHSTDSNFFKQSIVSLSPAADGPEAYAKSVVALASDESTRSALGRRGCHYYQEHLDWGVTAAYFHQVASTIIG